MARGVGARLCEMSINVWTFPFCGGLRSRGGGGWIDLRNIQIYPNRTKQVECSIRFHRSSHARRNLRVFSYLYYLLLTRPPVATLHGGIDTIMEEGVMAQSQGAWTSHEFDSFNLCPSSLSPLSSALSTLESLLVIIFWLANITTVC